MIWANNLGKLEYYLIAGFLIAYIIYSFRIYLISQKNIKVDILSFFKKAILRVSYFLLILMALMGPSFGDVKKELKSVGKDIFILMDVSSSMDAYDIPPSRLEKAKKELNTLIRNLQNNDRIGIIVFTKEAYLQCPLTYDLDAVLLYLQTIQSGALPVGGTDLPNALRFASKKFQSVRNSKSLEDKIIILASDGEDFNSDEEKAISELKNNNILLFSLGIGTINGSKIPVHPGFKIHKNGMPVITRLNKNKLEKIALATGGNYFQINNEENNINLLLETLNKLKGRVKEIKKIEISSNKYYYFLSLALILIILDGLLTVNIIRL